MDQIFKRTSIRRYLDQPVEAEKTEYLLKAAMQAPSAGNQQPWEFYVITNRDILEKLSKISPYARACRKGTYSDRSCCPE